MKQERTVFLKTRAAEESYIKRRRIATEACQKNKRESLKKELETLCTDFNDKQSISNFIEKLY